LAALQAAEAHVTYGLGHCAIRSSHRGRRETGEHGMPITLLDLILLVVMLVSALLAMIRGFMREILSIAAWAIAALAAIYSFPRLVPLAKQAFSGWPDMVTTGVVVGGVFLITLLIVSVITVRVSDMVLDSRVGALDRTLGFLFGLGRGLIIVVVAFLFFSWLVPPRGQPDWVRNAKSVVVLQGTGDWLQSLLPQDMDNYLSNWFKRRPKGEDQEPQDTPPPDSRSDLTAPRSQARGGEPNGYERSDRDGMRQLIENKTATAR
jgi:membrane protein required for colicin V production